MGKRTQDRARLRRAFRTRAIVTAAAVVLAGAGAVVLNSGPGTAKQTTTATTAAPAIAPVVPAVSALALSRSTDGDAELAARSTKPFSSVGVTWTDVHAALKGTVQVRTRSSATGRWSGWISLGAEDSLPDPSELDRSGVRGGTEPHWVSASDGVQVRVVTAKGTTALPAGLTVDLVDPGSASSSGSSSSGIAPAGYAMDDSTTDSATATATTTASASASSSDSSSADDSASASSSADSSDSASSSATASTTPSTSSSTTASTTPSASASAGTSTSATAGASSSASGTASSELPTLAQAYPTCTGASASATAETGPSPTPATTTSSIAAPTIVSRAAWGADECIRESGYPDYGTAVKVVFVHHTDDSNSYTCSESAAMVRSIYAYHVEVEGWRDIGYNYLVDKCGTIFEGRFGGEALPVVGAQTYGMNTNSMGIAAIGTYTDLTGGDSADGAGATPTKAMLGSIARIAAWKLGMSGVNPATGKGTLVEGGTYAGSGYKFSYGQQVTLNAVSGHRDGFATDCPGNQLYADLSLIRSYAVGPVTGLSVTGLSGGAAKTGSEYVTKGKATVSWTTATPAAVISGFTVTVDGKTVASTSGTATSAAITVTPGSHSVRVIAKHITGSTTTSAAVTLVGDTTAPTFSTAPSVSLRTGTVSATWAPVTLSWKATDNVALGKVAATSPSAASFAAATTSWATYGAVGKADLFTLLATDVAGNTRSASVTRTPSLVQETSTTRTGVWTKRTSSSYLGGGSYSSSAKNATISWTFTGRSVAWIVSRASTSGQAYVYVDGVKIGLVDLKSSSTLYRQAIWTKSWAAGGKHTLKIVVVGTSGRPTVTTDGIAVIG